MECVRRGALREALQTAIAAVREEGYSPLRDPEHPMYNASHIEDGPHNYRGIVWEDDEPEEDTGDGEVSEEQNPRWRTVNDNGWK